MLHSSSHEGSNFHQIIIVVCIGLLQLSDLTNNCFGQTLKTTTGNFFNMMVGWLVGVFQHEASLETKYFLMVLNMTVT